MKIPRPWLFVPVVVWLFAGCGEKESETVGVSYETPAQLAAEANGQVPEVEVPAEVTPEGGEKEEVVVPVVLSAEERAAKLGFVRYLPDDVEAVISFHQGAKVADSLTSLKLWQLMSENSGVGIEEAPMELEMEEEGFEMPEENELGEDEPDVAAGGDLEEMDGGEISIENDAPGPLPAKELFGLEVTLATGKGTADQAANLLTMYRRMGYFQFREMTKAFVEMCKTGDPADFMGSMVGGLGEDFFKELLADPESGVGLYEKMGMPPIYLAVRATPETVQSALASLTQPIMMLGQFGEEAVELVEVERGAHRFEGYKIRGEKIVGFFEDSRESMDEALTAEVAERLLAATKKKDLVLLGGVVGEHAVLFIGSSEDDLRLVESPADSLCAGDALAFADAYAGKDLVGWIHGKQVLVSGLMQAAGGIRDMANGLRDGLNLSEGIGETRDIEALLQMVVEREKVLLGMARHEATGTVAYLEDGLKIESFGGTDSGMFDWDAENRLAQLGDDPDVVFFANMTGNAEFDRKARDYYESILETLYALALKVSEVAPEEGQMGQFKEWAGMFDEMFRPEIVALWDAMSGDFAAGVGGETAVVVDLKGAVPAIPGIPQQMVDEGRFPRVTMLMPVENREKIAASWQTMNESLTRLAGSVSKVMGSEIAMQKPMSSEKNDLVTWFFSFPFLQDDFMPSVTLGEQWFAASSSKLQAQDLIGRASAAGGAAVSGARFRIQFAALEAFVKDSLEVIAKNPEALPLGQEELEALGQMAEVLGDFEDLSIHARKEGGVMRSSLHFKGR